MDGRQWHDVVRQLGLCRTCRGYGYLICALKLIEDDPRRLEAPTKEIYPVVARAFRTTPAGVDGGLRTAAKLCRRRHPGLFDSGVAQLSVKAFLGAVYRRGEGENPAAGIYNPEK